MIYRNVFLGLGSNIGDKLINLRFACSLINGFGHTKIEKYSSVYKTKPVGYRNQPDFFNACIRVSTELGPFKLLKFVKRVEKLMGRDFSAKRWGPRLIDIDILLFNNAVIKSKILAVPHRELLNRGFNLAGIRDIDRNTFKKLINNKEYGAYGKNNNTKDYLHEKKWGKDSRAHRIPCRAFKDFE